MAVKKVMQRELVPEPADLGLVDGPLDLALVAFGGEVEDRAGDGGDGDAVVHGDLVGGKGAFVEEERSSGAPLVRHRDLDTRLGPAPDAPEGRGRAVAQDCTGSAGEHRCHPSSLPRHRQMSDGVNGAIKRVETLEPQAGIDGVGPQSELEQLPPRHHAVLTNRELRDQPVHSTGLTFAAYLAVNVRRMSHGRHRGRRRGAGGLRVLRVSCGFVPR
jgi:hypothetical protein